MTVTTPIYPILLAGGAGSRLWPLSRQSYPKQFVPLIGAESLFQAAARRVAGPEFAAPLTLTHSDYRFVVTEQLHQIGVDPGAILIEPERRNTGPAILAAALWLARENPQALMLVVPSDHHVPDTGAFRAAVARGRAAAEAGSIVTFGVRPIRAETGYGYLELAAPLEADCSDAVDLLRFVEKPAREEAERMVSSGRHLWNAGIFLFSASAIIDAFKSHAAELIEPVANAIETGKTDLGFFRLNPEPWAKLPDISIDYAIMERAENLAVVPFDAAWSDLGGWDAVWRESAPDGDGVATSGAATALECTNTLLRSEDDRLELIGLGLDNIIAVAMPDAVLVADKSRAQDVKQAVQALKQKHARQAETFPRQHRPWGWYECLALSERFQVKRIVVQPGAALSLQSHLHRSEHWVVVEGTAKITIGEETRLVSENQSVYVPLGEKHRLENPGKLPMVLIEVQTGGYLGEDDITRYEDLYARD